MPAPSALACSTMPYSAALRLMGPPALSRHRASRTARSRWLPTVVPPRWSTNAAPLAPPKRPGQPDHGAITPANRSEDIQRREASLGHGPRRPSDFLRCNGPVGDDEALLRVLGHGDHQPDAPPVGAEVPGGSQRAIGRRCAPTLLPHPAEARASARLSPSKPQARRPAVHRVKQPIRQASPPASMLVMSGAMWP